MMRRVSGDRRGPCRRRRRGALISLAAGGGRDGVSGAEASAGGAAVSGSAALVLAISIADAIQRFDLRKLIIDRLELLAQPLDVAVDRAVVDIDVLAIGGVHQLVAVLHVTGSLRERFEDQ